MSIDDGGDSVASLKVALSSSKQENEAMFQEICALRSENERLQQRQIDQAREATSLRSDVRNLKREVACVSELRFLVDMKKTEVEKLISREKELMASLSAVKLNEEKLSTELKQALSKYSEASTELLVRSKQLKELKHRCSELEGESAKKGRFFFFF